MGGGGGGGGGGGKAAPLLSEGEITEAKSYGVYTELSSNYAELPNFHSNLSGAIQKTDNTRADGNKNTGKGSDLTIYSGFCTAHWGTNDVYDKFVADNRIPSKLSGNQLITDDSVNILKNLINILIRGWVQGGDTRTFSKNKTFQSTNEKLDSTVISNEASKYNIITSNLWDDILARLQIFDNAVAIAAQASAGVDTPTTSTVITRSNYNHLIDVIKLVSKACKCNSDCACNAVCICNADCGCNYS